MASSLRVVARVGLVAGLASLSLFAVYACVGSDAPAATPPSGDDDAAFVNDSGDPNTNPTDSGADAPVEDAAHGFCATLAPTPGAADFFCADFDEGTDAAAGWTAAESFDGGTGVTITTDVETSKPNAIAAQPPAGDPISSAGPSLTWTASGAKQLTSVIATANLNPTFNGSLPPHYTGIVRYLRITTADAELAFGYARGATVFPLATGAAMSDYTGYVLFELTSGGAAQLVTYAVPTGLTPNVWTTVALTYVTSGQVKLTYNGISVVDHAMYSTVQTSANVILGGVPATVQLRFRGANTIHINMALNET